jgi:nuclease S1
LHLVGDVHQPLHCSARVTAIERKGDHGGQDFELAPLSSLYLPGERYSLHAYWDGMLDRAAPRRSGERLGAYLQRATALVVSHHPRAELEADLKPGQFDAWARESVVAAQSAYPASLRRGQEPSADYRSLGIRVALGRLALAGYRLALMLRDVAGVAGR